MSIKLKNILYTILEQDEYSKAADDIASSAVETKNEPLNVDDAVAAEPPRSEKMLTTIALGYYLDSNKSTLTELFGKKGSKEITINNVISKFIGGLNGDEKKRFENIGGTTKIKKGFSGLDKGKTEITTSEDNVFIFNKTSDSRFTVKLSSKDKEYKPIDPLGDFIKQAGGGDSGLSKIIGTNENLRNWFKKEKWKRIDTQGNIAGDCGTMPKGKKTQRCLPAAKAKSLTKKQRAATSRKKTASNKQFVKNTKAAKVKLKKNENQ